MKWGEIVRTLRRLHGAKQDAFSQLIGVNQATISRWESGGQMPGPAHQALLLNLYSQSLQQDCGHHAPVETAALPLAASLVHCRFIGMILADERRILQANDAFLDMLGYNRATLEDGGLDWQALTPPEFAAEDRRALRQVLETGRLVPFRKAYRHKNGHLVPVLLVGEMETASPLRIVASVIALSECRPPLPPPAPA